MAEDPTAMLRSVLMAAQSPDRDVRKQAEAHLEGLKQQPGYAQQLVRLIEAHCSGTTPQDKALRSLAAIMFKNLVKTSWLPPEDGDFTLPAGDKDAIKGNMVHMMSITPPEVQRQFSEALSIISKYDYPEHWEALMPELVARLQSDDFNVVLNMLVSINSVCKRFRNAFKTDEIMAQLVYTLDHLAVPYIAMLKKCCTAIATSSSSPEQLTVVFECLRLLARIFYSLNWLDIPEFFEDSMADWSAIFAQFLAYSGPQPPEPAEETEPGGLEKLQASIVEIVNLYASKYDEEFASQLPAFTGAVWALLVKVGTEQKHDILATTCIRFLTSIVGKQMHTELFAAPGTLRQIVENIVVPNLRLRESDEEMFEDDPMDYIQRDMEGSDSDTRRRVSCDLVRSMCKHHEQATTAICSEYMAKLLEQYSTDPTGQWRSKDAAIQLLLALSVKAESSAHGVSATNAYLNVMDVFAQSVLPEIADVAAVNERPIVRSDCVKFVTTFRNQFTVEQMRSLLPLLMAHLRSEHVVVATYAALAIEKLLLVKDKSTATTKAVPRFGKADLQPHLEQLFTGLFGVLDNPDLPENDYGMKAIMRALNTAQESIVPVAHVVLARQTAYLARVCANPANPQFNHYLFESIAVLVSKVCQADSSTIATFEEALFPPFQQVNTLKPVIFWFIIMSSVYSIECCLLYCFMLNLCLHSSLEREVIVSTLYA
jgi:exportin-2 (importin alpha re-exporter)